MSIEISTSLSSYKEIDDVIQKTTGSFSFTDALGGFVNNREFSKGYYDFKQGANTSEAFIWQILSCIGEHVGNVVYSNILEYVDNICNIDVCKIKSLKSILNSFGLKYPVIDNIDTIPMEIQNVIDVLSINKRYLLSSGIVSDKLLNELNCAKYNILSLDNIKDVIPESEYNQLSGVYDSISSNFTEKVAKNIRINDTIDDSIYEAYLSVIFRNLITSIVSLPYAESVDYLVEDTDGKMVLPDCLSASEYKFWPIYKTYGSVINKTEEKESLVSEQDESINKLKIKNNLIYFNEKAIVTNIYNGKDSLDNYNGTELEILELEIKNREAAKYKDIPTSKFAYYKEQKVYEYFDFIKNKFGNLSSKYIEYIVDSNYFEIKNNVKSKSILLLSSDENSVYSLNDNFEILLDAVIQNLVYYTTSIAKLREKIKIQLQKNNMKGTFNLLSYVINEYLIELSKSTMFNSIDDTEGVQKALASLSTHIQSDINIIEYYDGTEYFNIKNKNSSKSKYKKTVNAQYWQSLSSDSNVTNYSFAKEDIEKFYLSTLNLKNTTNDLVTFLSTIYTAGANTSYIDVDGIQRITAKDGLDSEVEDMVNQFSGDRDVGILQHYNHKNKAHSSYQIHPYLYNFIETTNFNKVVNNGYYNDVVQEEEDEIVLSRLSSNIGEFGQLINVALNNQYDFTGYRTGYEKSLHRSTKQYSTTPYEVIDYPGAFYPPAVEMFVDDVDGSICSLSGKQGEFYERFYQHLNLNDAEIDRICNQLSSYSESIKDIVSEKNSQAKVWDIYKYGKDNYDNHYILYKNYYDQLSRDDITDKDKKDALGELWIRLNNHPIAFPAIAGKFPQIATENAFINGKFFGDVRDKSYAVEADRFCKFYDMEFDSSKSIIFLAYYPIKDSNPFFTGYNGVFYEYANHEYIYKDYEHSAFIICQINQQYNADKRYTQLELNSNRKDADNIDGYLPTKGRFIKANDTGYAFEGFYKYEDAVGLVFVKKKFSVVESTSKYTTSYSFPNENEIQFGIVKFVAMDERHDIFNSDEAKIKIENCTFTNPYIGFNYYNNNLVFAVITHVDNSIQNFKTFVGTINSINSDLSTYGNVNYYENSEPDELSGIYNSFDVFEDCVAIVEFSLNGIDITKNSVKLHNMVAAPSYVPIFPGLSGQLDFSNCEYYNTIDKSIIPIQPLGKSNLKSSYQSLIDSVDPYFDVLATIEDLDAKLESRVYEDFTGIELDESIRIFRNNTLQFSNTIDNYCEWTIDLTDKFIKGHEDYIKVSIINYKTYGRNQYYSGTLNSLVKSAEEDFIQLNYTSSYIDAELSCYGDESVGVAGTYSIYSAAQNKSETNAIYNISDVRAKYDPTTKLLTLRFYRIDKNILSMIQYGLIQCILLDTADLRIFKYYHLLDQFNVIKSVISVVQNGETFKEIDNRYYPLANNNKYYLSGYQLSDYTALSDVPYLSGFDTASFKFSEDSVVDKHHDMYYEPGYNDTFPKTFAQLYKISTIRKTTDIYADIGGGDNTFILKLNSPSMISSIGNVDIPINVYDSDSVRVYESYLSVDETDGVFPYNKYDTVDIRLMQYYKLIDTAGIVKYTAPDDDSDVEENNDITVNFDVSSTNNPVDFANNVKNALTSDLSGLYFLKNEEADTVLEDPFYYSINTNQLSINGDKLADFVNVYVNYIKNDDNTIDLYFNYINYICTPYVKFRGENLALDYIPSTYLKLKPGEDGILDIILQFKYYKDQHLLYGYKNVTIASYKIYNVSDDKPKFVIYKQMKI